MSLAIKLRNARTIPFSRVLPLLISSHVSCSRFCFVQYYQMDSLSQCAPSHAHSPGAPSFQWLPVDPRLITFLFTPIPDPCPNPHLCRSPETQHAIRRLLEGPVGDEKGEEPAGVTHFVPRNQTQCPLAIRGKHYPQGSLEPSSLTSSSQVPRRAWRQCACRRPHGWKILGGGGARERYSDPAVGLVGGRLPRQGVSVNGVRGHACLQGEHVTKSS